MRLSDLYNPLMVLLLRSPLHGLVSQSLMAATVTGRKSHEDITVPVTYLRDGDTLFVISHSSRRWWRNLRGGAPVRLMLEGRELTGSGDVLENADCVGIVLKAWLRRVPAYAKLLGVKLDVAGLPDLRDLSQAAAGRVVVRFKPDWANQTAMQTRRSRVAVF